MLPCETLRRISLRGIHSFHCSKSYALQFFGTIIHMILKILSAGVELLVKAHIVRSTSKFNVVLAIKFRENPFDR